MRMDLLRSGGRSGLLQRKLSEKQVKNWRSGWLLFCDQLQIAASYSVQPRLEGYGEVGVGTHNWLQLSILYTLYIILYLSIYRWIYNFTYLILIRASMKSFLTSPHGEYIWSTQVGDCYFFLFLNSPCKCADREVLSISFMGFLSECWVFGHSCFDSHHGCPITPLAGLASFLRLFLADKVDFHLLCIPILTELQGLFSFPSPTSDSFTTGFERKALNVTNGVRD